jgi:hypothetical protein
MQVVRHPAKGMSPGGKFCQQFADDALKGFPVRGRPEEGAAFLAAERDVMDFALQAQAGCGRSRHVPILARRMGEMQVANLMIFWSFRVVTAGSLCLT